MDKVRRVRHTNEGAAVTMTAQLLSIGLWGKAELDNIIPEITRVLPRSLRQG